MDSEVVPLGTTCLQPEVRAVRKRKGHHVSSHRVKEPRPAGLAVELADGHAAWLRAEQCGSKEHHGRETEQPVSCCGA